MASTAGKLGSDVSCRKRDSQSVEGFCLTKEFGIQQAKRLVIHRSVIHTFLPNHRKFAYAPACRGGMVKRYVDVPLKDMLFESAVDR